MSTNLTTPVTEELLRGHDTNEDSTLNNLPKAVQSDSYKYKPNREWGLL